MAEGQDAIQLRVDAPQFTSLFGKSSQVDAKLRAALRKRMRKAADEAAVAVRAEVLAAPTSGGRGKSRGLRRGIAAGIKVRVSTGGKKVGIHIISTGSGLPPEMKPLVRAYNKNRWRHPVFGQTTTHRASGARGRLLRRKVTKDVWVQQKGRPYFEAVIDKHQPAVQAAVLSAMEEAVQSLTHP